VWMLMQALTASNWATKSSNVFPISGPIS
jgi:hypothetical protein